YRLRAGAHLLMDAVHPRDILRQKLLWHLSYDRVSRPLYRGRARRPGLTRAIGSTPPNVHAYCFSVGTIRLTSMVSITAQLFPPHAAQPAPGEPWQVPPDDARAMPGQ